MPSDLALAMRSKPVAIPVFTKLGPVQLVTQALEKAWLEGGDGEPAVATSIQAVTGESSAEDGTGCRKPVP